MKTFTTNSTSTFTIPAEYISNKLNAKYNNNKQELIDAVYETADGKLGAILFYSMHCVNYIEVNKDENGKTFLNINSSSFGGNIKPHIHSNGDVTLNCSNNGVSNGPKYIHTFDNDDECKEFIRNHNAAKLEKIRAAKK